VEERLFILESYLKTMSYAHCRQSFFEKFRRQAPVKSAIAKMILKFRETGSLLTRIVIGRKVAKNIVKRVDKCIEMNGYHSQHLL
jgi:Tfp pilus assembly protein PilO